MRRRIVLIVVAAIVAIAAAVLIAHVPIVRRAVLRYAIANVQQQYGIALGASRLDYNLAALRVGLADVRVAAAGKQPPFFEADYVSAAVPWRTLLRDISFDSVVVTNGVVRIVRTSSGETNLPASREESDTDPAPLRIARLAVSPLRVDVRDEGSALALDIPGASVELTPRDGRVTITAPATVTFGDRRTRMTMLDGAARFDGRTLQLIGMQLRADEGQLQVDGGVTLIAKDPALSLRISGSGEIARLARWGMDEREAPQGEVAFTGRVSGPIDALIADVDATAPRIRWNDLAVSNAAARARVTADGLSADRIAFDVQGGHIEGSAAMPFSDSLEPAVRRLTANARVQLTNAPTPFTPLSLPGESRVQVANGMWSLEGRHRVGDVAPTAITLQGRLAEDLGASTVTGTAGIAETDVPALAGALRRARLVDIPADAVPSGSMRASVDVSGTFDRVRATFKASSERLTTATPPASGPLTVTGMVDTASQRYTFDGTLTDWALTPTTDLPVSGRFDATLRGGGRAAEMMAEGDVTGREIVWQDMTIGDVTGHVQLDPARAQIVANVPSIPASADAVIALEAPYQATVNARAENVDLSRFTAGIRAVPLTGTATAVLRAMLPLQDWRRGSAQVEIPTLEASAGELPLRLTEPAVARYDAGRVFLDRLEASAGETHVAASGDIAAFRGGSADAGLIATVTGDVGEVARAVAATGLTTLPIEGGNGPVAVLARLTGSLEEPIIAADAELGPGAITLQDLPTISDLHVRTHVEEGWLDLREARGTYQDAAITATGRVPLSMLGVEVLGVQSGEASLRARATNVTASVLEPFLDRTAVGEISGALDATVALDSPSLDLAAVKGALEIDRFDVRIADLPVTQRVPTRIGIADGFARIEAWDWAGQGATLALRGQVRLSDRQMAVLADGEVDLRMATPFVRAAGLTTAGTLRPRLSITGDMADLRIDGDLLITGAEMRLSDPRVVISDLSGRAVLTRSTATLAGMTGSINGGALTLEGGAEFGPDARLETRLSADVRGMAFEYPAGLRTELNAILELMLASGSGQPMPGGTLSGTVTVVRGAYRQPLAVLTGLLANLRAARIASVEQEAGALDNLALDIRLVTDDDLIVDNNYGRFQVGADVRAIGTLSSPGLSGRVELREGGQLFVGRNVYTITSGRLISPTPLPSIRC
jgi:autotransporter translocation and assembly factor TamB